jgi:HSP20 family molecular chaperone IbpA
MEKNIMANSEEKSMEVPEQELVPTEEMERTRERRCFVPKTDIYETEEDIVVVADLPGVDQNSIDITLEKNILTIAAFGNPTLPEGFNLLYAEYEPGDYQRSFRITSDIEHDEIEATVSNGELRLRLPKADSAKVKKIPVKTG